MESWSFMIMNIKKVFNEMKEAEDFISSITNIALIMICSNLCDKCVEEEEILNALSTEFPDIDIFKVNMDESDGNMALAATLGIELLPALLFIIGGEVVETKDGLFLSGFYNTDELKLALKTIQQTPENLKTLFVEMQ